MSLHGQTGEHVPRDLYASAEDADITQRCAEMIREYWITRGFATIQAIVGKDKNGYRAITSNMVNGIPPVVSGMENVARAYRRVVR